MESVPNPPASGKSRNPLEGNLFDDLQPVPAETHDLARVVRDEPDATEAEVGKDLDRKSVV